MAINDVIGLYLDMDNKTLGFTQNNTDRGIHFSTGLSNALTGTVYPAVGDSPSACTFTARFNSASHSYSPPSGYTAGFYG